MIIQHSLRKSKQLPDNPAVFVNLYKTDRSVLWNAERGGLLEKGIFPGIFPVAAV